MDLNKFRSLPQAERLQLCREYSQHPALSLLKEMLLDKQTKLPDITNCDSKEAFLYKSIYQKAQADLLLTFDNLAENIERGLKRA